MTAKAHKTVFEVMEMLCILTVVMFMQEYPFVKTHQTTLNVEVFYCILIIPQ